MSNVLTEGVVRCLCLLMQGHELGLDHLGAFRAHAIVRLVRARHQGPKGVRHQAAQAGQRRGHIQSCYSAGLSFLAHSLSEEAGDDANVLTG